MVSRILLLSLAALAAIPGCAPGPCGGPWYMDSDGDGTIDRMDSDADGDGYTAAQGDCADCDAARGPNFPDTTCDGVDQDCDEHDGLDGDAGGCVEPMAPGRPPGWDDVTPSAYYGVPLCTWRVGPMVTL